MDQELNLGRLSSYSLLCTQLDFVDQGVDMLQENFRHALLHDPLLQRSSGPEQFDQLAAWEPVIDMLHSMGVELPIVTGGTCHGTPKDEESFDAFANAVEREYRQLLPEERNIVINGFQAHQAGILLPLALVRDWCSPLEYGEAWVAATPEHPRIFSGTWGRFAELLHGFRLDAGILLDFLQLYRERDERAVMALIRSGESSRVEFKSTLRFNLKAGRITEDIEHAILKTLAAFMNTEGGTLLVGVSDAGEVLGLDPDGFASNDKLLLHLTNIVVARIDDSAPTYLNPQLVTCGGKSVLRVNVKPSRGAMYVKGKGDEEFFIRTGPSTTRLAMSSAYDYISKKFK